MRRLVVITALIALVACCWLVVSQRLPAARATPSTMREQALPRSTPAPQPQADAPTTVPPIGSAGPLPAQTPTPANARPVPPGLQQQRDLRRRVGEAAGLGRRAQSGDTAAAAEVARRLADEADPRVRQALESGEVPPDLGKLSRWAPPALPEPAAPAEAGETHAYWLTPGNDADGTYESTVSVDAQGRAQVVTVHESLDGERWQVRYGGWAFRDRQGRLVVDARGQPVEYVERPRWGNWSPDSLIIGTDGLIDTIDDRHDSGQGTSGSHGPG